MSHHPSYLGVFLTFVRNSLVRDMTFRANFLIETFSSMSWMIMNLGFYVLVYQFTPSIGGWGKFRVLCIHRHHDVRQQPGAGVLHA